MADKSVPEKKSQYENSALRQLMEASGHEICPRCYCCDWVSNSSTCWQCNGMEPELDDWEDSGDCSVCDGEGKVYWKDCIGRCDEHGDHAKKGNLDDR